MHTRAGKFRGKSVNKPILIRCIFESNLHPFYVSFYSSIEMSKWGETCPTSRIMSVLHRKRQRDWKKDASTSVI